MTPYLNKFYDLCKKATEHYNSSLPLCAAENVISPFSKLPLTSSIQEKYILGGTIQYDNNYNFIGSSELYGFYELLNRLCQDIFHSEYADGRTLSGVNAVTTLLMSLFKANDTILITGEEYGGHSSMPKVAHRLGINTIELPYLYEEKDFDYMQINILLREHNINGILICLSDILRIPKLNQIVLPDDCILIFDATQILGLIAGGMIKNPFDWFSENQKFIMLGATHKTLPGPTCGLIMTKNKLLSSKFDTKINPDYLRNNQMHHIMSLILTLIEMKQFGNDYSYQIVKNTNYLGTRLSSHGFSVIKSNQHFSDTHQLFISMPYEETINFYQKCKEYNVTLNARFRKCYQNSGIRIGTQEITRYGWTEYEIDTIAQILNDIGDAKEHNMYIDEKINNLSKQKHIHYTFSENEYQFIKNALHHC